MDEQDLDKLFECFKKSESNRCGENTSKDRLYYNKPNTGNCSCQNGIEQKPTRSSALSFELLKSVPEPIKQITLSSETSKPASKLNVTCKCREDSVLVQKIKEISNPVLEPRIICKCGENIPPVSVEKIKVPSSESSNSILEPRIICQCGGNIPLASAEKINENNILSEVENIFPKTTIECECGENSITSASASAQKFKNLHSELTKHYIECKCEGKNNASVPPASVQKSITKLKQGSLEIINNTFSSNCQNINSSKDHFHQNLKSLQNQIDATNRNIESVRDLNKDLKSGVCYLQNSLNNLKEGKHSLDSFNLNYNVEKKCAVCKQPDETLNKLKKPSIITCNGIPLPVAEKYSNFSDNSCFPCKESKTPIELQQPSVFLPSKCSDYTMTHPASGVRKFSSNECYSCKKIEIPTNLKKISSVACSRTKDNTETGTSVIDNLTKCAEQCRQYLDAISAARTANAKVLKIQNDVNIECDQIQQVKQDRNVSCGGTKISSNVAESAHKCQQYTNKANNASQVEDLFRTKSKFNATVQCDWERNDQSTQYTENRSNVNTNEAATESDLKTCTNKAVQCSNKINNAAQSEVFVKLKNNVEVQSTWDTKNQTTQYDQISNAETEICSDLLKCTKCVMTTQDKVESDVYNTSSIRGSPKFAYSRKDDATQSIIIPDVSNKTNKCVQCSHVTQNGTQAENLDKYNKPTKDEATLAVNETKTENKYEQCSTASETPNIIPRNEKKQCGWKKIHQTTQATENVNLNLYHEAASLNKVNKLPLLSMQNSIKSQTDSREVLQIDKKNECLPCAKEIENLTQTHTGNKNVKSENEEVQQPLVTPDKRATMCPHCLLKMNNTENSKPLKSAETQSSYQTETKTMQFSSADNVNSMLKKKQTECALNQQFANKIDNGSQSEGENGKRYDNNKSIAVQCHQKSQNASTQSIDKNTTRKEAKTDTSSIVTICVDQCQQSTKSNNITQTKSSTLQTQCALEAEDKITQAAANVCQHCLNKLTEANINDLSGFNFQNGEKTQSLGGLYKNDSKILSNETSIKTEATYNDGVNKYKCRQCRNLAEYSAQTESIKSLNIRKSVKSQTETQTSSDELSKTRTADSVDKGIQSSNKRDRESQTDQISIARLSVKIQTGNCTRKKSNAKRSSFTSQTSLKRLGSSTRTKTQKPMQSTSGILKNCNKNSQNLRKNNSAECQTSPVSNYYLSSLNSNNKCDMNRNYCSSSSNYMCNSNCSRHRHNNSCYLP